MLRTRRGSGRPDFATKPFRVGIWGDLTRRPNALDGSIPPCGERLVHDAASLVACLRHRFVTGARLYAPSPFEGESNRGHFAATLMLAPA
jgi:hypothetical protein